MRAFIYRSLVFSALLLAILVFSLFFIKEPNTEAGMLAALKDKHERLQSIKSPKLIFAGGSNLSFGLISKMVSDSLRLPVVNMGLHAGMGLQFIASELEPWVSEGDIVVIVPEYEHFYSANFYGETELVTVLFDVRPEGRHSVDAAQWCRLLRYLPVYAAKKIKNRMGALFSNEVKVDPIYERRSFNEYGDAVAHYGLPDFPFGEAPALKGNESFLADAGDFLMELNARVSAKGAKLMLLPPCIEKSAFAKQENIINIIKLRLAAAGLPFAASPESYRYEKSYFFNSYYHLNKKGAEMRTRQLVLDVKQFLNKTW